MFRKINMRSQKLSPLYKAAEKVPSQFSPFTPLAVLVLSVLLAVPLCIFYIVGFLNSCVLQKKT